MKQKKIPKRSAWYATLVLIGLVSVFVWGCSSLQSDGATTEVSPPPAEPAPESTPIYYDFGDVLVPREMKVEKEDSFVYRTPGMTVGLLTLKGPAEAGSLTDFFKNKMPVDGWRLISSIEGQRTMMLFQKNNRWCVINITGGQFSTTAEVWLSTNIGGIVDGSGATKLKK